MFYIKKTFQLIQQEKTKHLSTSEKKPFRFVDKIETIDHVKQSQTTPTQTEVTLDFRFIYIRYFY